MMGLFEIESHTVFPRLASNHELPNLCPMGSYRHLAYVYFTIGGKINFEGVHTSSLPNGYE
jgi:hypothetical protein